MTTHCRWTAAHALRPRLVALLVRRSLSLEDAEDVASETIIKAARKTELPVDDMMAWCSRVAQNAAIDLHRAKLSPELIQRLGRLEPRDIEPQLTVDERYEAAWVAQRVAELPERQRLVLSMRVKGHSWNDIAGVLGVPYKTIESLVSRARATVRKAMAAAGCLLAALAALGRRSTPILPAAALASAVVLLPSWHDSDSPSPPGNRPPGQALSVSPWLSGTTAAEDRTATPQAAEPKRRSPAPKMIPSAPPRVARALVPAASVAGVDYSGAATTRSNEDESFVESAMSCIRGGIEVSLTNVGCKAEP